MNFKKILCSILVVCMVLSTMGITAFADVASGGNVVATVGGTSYTDIQEAIKAAAPAGTVEIVSDVTVDEWIMFSQRLSIGSGQIITLDMNGLTINGNNNTLTVNSVESATNGDRLFHEADNLNINNLTIKYADGVVGGISLKSGTISNVTFEGGVGVFPGEGNITITGCKFYTNGSAIYNDTERDNLVVTDNTFNTAAGQYAIYLRGNTTFTGNTVVNGKVNVVSGSPVVTGNNFGEERFKVYNAANATIKNNEINELVFNDANIVNSTFVDNTLSESADEALKDAGVLYGAGIEEEPFLINNVDDFISFRNNVNAGNNYAGKYVKLNADIDLSSVDNWTPIGATEYNNKYAPVDSSVVFSGVFDGNNKVISNLKIEKIISGGADAEATIGLFGITGEGAVIKDLTITNVNINTDGRNVGALAGFAYKTALKNITINGNIQISGGNNVSGVCAMTRYYDMSATNITVSGADGSAITGNNIVGGIFAEIAPNGSTQTFENLSVENVAINGVGGVGGIVGLLTNGSVSNVSVKDVALVGKTEYQGNAMGRIRLGAIAGLLGGSAATISDVEVENVTAKNLDNNNVILPVVGANYDASSNATEAKIGDVYYATFTKALSAASQMSGDVTIDLLADVTWETGAAHGSTPMVEYTAICGNVTINGNDYKITATGAGVGPIRDARSENKLTFNNVNFVDESVSYAEHAWEFTYLEFGGNLKFDTCSFASGIAVDGDSAEFINCKFCSPNKSEYAVWVSEGETSFDKCYFTGTRGLKVHEAYGSEVDKLSVTNSTFEDITEKPGIAIGTLNAATEMTITNNEFINVQPGDQGNYSYETDTDVATITFTDVNNKSGSGKMSYGVYCGAPTGTYNTPSYRESIKVDIYNVHAKESLVVKLYSDDTLVSTSTLRQTDRDDVTNELYPFIGSATANIVVKGRLAGSWDTVWETKSVDLLPNKIEAYVDGVLVDTYEGEMSDNYKKIYTSFTGVEKYVYVQFEEIPAAEGEREYNIVLASKGNSYINELASADLTFVFEPTPVDNQSDMSYFVTPAQGVTLSQIGDRYMFNYDGINKHEESGQKLVIGKVAVSGYGKFNFSTAKGEVYATEIYDNIVDGYEPSAEIILNIDMTENDGMVGKIENAENEIPTRELTIDIAFPNAVENKEVAYQDMTVTIVGGKVNETIHLGTDGEAYNFTRDLPYNTAYTVTVEGAGYRTARYTVNLTKDKTLNFWNNVMTNEKEVEVGEANSKTTTTFLAGEIVKDNKINIYDLSAVVSYFGETGLDAGTKPEYAKYDLNRDGKIDAKDVAYVLVSWGK